MRINHNVPSLDAVTRLSQTNLHMEKSLAKLSSGLKIVRASDDAAGLAVSEKLRAQINAIEQASYNAQDGISVLQTAEGALNVVHNILQRLNTLAMRAANTAVLSDDDIALIQEEADQLVEELDRIAPTITFNTKVLLDGSYTGQVLQVGPGATINDQITISITGVDAATLGVDGLDLATDAQGALTAIQTAINTVSENRATIGAVMNRLEKTIENLDVQKVNMTASESRIRDVDMAAEIANYTRLQILQQSGIAMLAQANAAPQAIVNLLR